MFDSFFPEKFNHIMKTDVYEKEGYYFFDIELPGYLREDISIDITGGYLNIKAEQKNEVEEDRGDLIRSELCFGSAERSFYVGENLEAEDVKARFENGVLHVSLPSSKQKAIENRNQIVIE